MHSSVTSFFPFILLVSSYILLQVPFHSMYDLFPLLCPLNTGVTQESHPAFSCFYSVYLSQAILSVIITSVSLLERTTLKLVAAKFQTHTSNCPLDISPGRFHRYFETQTSNREMMNSMLPLQIFPFLNMAMAPLSS